jgi:hypothetical protein
VTTYAGVHRDVAFSVHCVNGAWRYTINKESFGQYTERDHAIRGAILTPLSRAKLIAQDGFADADGPKVVQRCRSRLEKQRRFRHRLAQLGDSLLGFG